jgi:hypothetical protein
VRRSSADGRDTHNSLDLARCGELLSGTGAALHPGLRLTRAGRIGDRAGVVPVYGQQLALANGRNAAAGPYGRRRGGLQRWQPGKDWQPGG